MLVDALPGERKGKQTWMAGRGFDDIPVPARLTVGELQRAGGLHRAVPHVDRHRHPPRDDGHRMDPEVPPDPAVPHA